MAAALEAATAPSRIWFVSPVYFDTESFVQLRERLHAELDADPRLSGVERRFLIVDDTAGRDSAVDALSALDDLEVIESPFNLGHQRGLVYAVRSLRDRLRDEDVVVTLDADGEDRPEDAPRLIEPLLDAPLRAGEVALALRVRRRDTTTAFRFGYLGFRGIFRLLTGTSIRTGNYAAYRGRVAKRLLLHPSFELCYSSTMIALDVPVRLIPCERGARYAGRSRMGYAKLSIHALRMLMPFSERIARRASIVFGTTFLIALALALVVLGVKLLGDAAIPGWATYSLGAISILSVVALGNLVILFTVFSQSRAISLGNLENLTDEGAATR